MYLSSVMFVGVGVLCLGGYFSSYPGYPGLSMELLVGVWGWLSLDIFGSAP